MTIDGREPGTKNKLSYCSAQLEFVMKGFGTNKAISFDTYGNKSDVLLSFVLYNFRIPRSRHGHWYEY